MIQLSKMIKLCIFVLVICLSCSNLRSLDSIQKDDLVGTWQSNYWDADGIDTLILKPDGTFQQIYKDSSGYVYKSDWNKWHLERLSDERLRVRLVGMRYYPEGIEIAESSEPLYLFDHSAPGDLIPGELMDGELVLRVKVGAIFEPRNIILRHLAYRDDTSEPVFSLINSIPQQLAD